MDNKFCKYCGCYHPLTTEFWYFKQDGKYSCKVRCTDYTKRNLTQIKQKSKERYDNNIERILQQKKDYYNNNKDKCNERSRQYRKNNPETVRKQKEEYNRRYAEKRKERHRQYCLENKKKVAEHNKLYRQKNVDRLREKRRKYKQNRLLNNLNFRIQEGLRNRLHQAIKGGYKSGSAVRDLGCSVSDFRQYLESKFQEGMTWDNWTNDGWHIDHIIPLSHFNLEDRNQLLIACHYTNLQPLWAQDNFQKSNKIEGHT